MLTNNNRRRPEQVDRANPRPENLFGHVIEMTAPDGDHAAATYRWDILIKCGDPRVAAVGAQWHPDTSADGWFGSPDNCAIDADGRLWISTDQGGAWPRTQHADGLYAVETEGELRGLSKLFFRVPVGAELCGPCFTPPTAPRCSWRYSTRRPTAAELEAVRPQFDVRRPRHPLAGFQPRHAAQTVRGGDPQEGRREDRGVSGAVANGARQSYCGSSIVEHLGTDTIVHGHLNGAAHDTITMRCDSDCELLAGSKTGISIPAGSLHLFDRETGRRLDFHGRPAVVKADQTM